MLEQRNAYKGAPLRAWVRVRLTAADGGEKELELLVDTRSPCAVTVDMQTMQQFNLGVTPGMKTNFGPLSGGWLRVQIPELGFDEDVLGYAGDAVVEAAKASHPDFEGLVGLLLLRLMGEYGGNRDAFWIRTSAGNS